MATYVLVPGFWLGAWAWQPVTKQLRTAGHEVYSMSLTGLGERAHLATPATDLETHITDIVNLLTFEDLHDVILVGHSGGGIAVTGAADRIPKRLARVVYLDSAPLPDGTAQFDTMPPEGQSFIRKRVEANGGWRLPLPSWEELSNVFGASLEGLGDKQRMLMRARAADQPFATATQPLRLAGAAGGLVAKTLITCQFPLAQVKEMIASGHPLFAALSGPDWQLLELPTGHWPMFSRPEDTAQILAGLARG
jgi:pimeloyl-ACP methyl ester carboxylesterase